MISTGLYETAHPGQHSTNRAYWAIVTRVPAGVKIGSPQITVKKGLTR